MLRNYVEVREWLEGFIPLVYGKEELGLARIENLLKLLGDPQKKFKSVLVGGTAGKGSTAFYISRLLQFAGPVRTFPPASAHSSNESVQSINVAELRAVGNPSSSATRKYKIGLHISPHLIYIGERMQIFQCQMSNVKCQMLEDGTIPVKRLVALVNEIKPVVDAIKSKQPELAPSYFEILVALSFLYFAQEKVEWAVVEVGLGGRLDATNVLDSEISVITNVGLDHTELLGDTVEKIAKEKAGIIKTKESNESKVSKVSKGILVVTGATGKALKVIEKVAKGKNALLINLNTLSEKIRPETDIERYISRYYYSLRSKEKTFVAFNKNLALLTVLALKMEVGEDVVKRAFSGKFTGRFEEIDENVVVDGAHNTDKIRTLTSFIKKNYPNKNISLVLAFKKGKNWQEMIDLLMKNLQIKKIIAAQYYATTDMGPTPSQRLRGVNKGSAVAPDEIRDFIKSKWKVKVESIKNSQEAVIEALNSTQLSNYPANQLVLVTGSLYLVGEARTLWKLPEF